MKIRNGYVSNSSSSSFICNKDVSKFCNCIELSKEQIKHINNHNNSFKLDESKRWWLTSFLSDGSDEYCLCNNFYDDYYWFYNKEDEIFCKDLKCYEYLSGGVGCWPNNEKDLIHLYDKEKDIGYCCFIKGINND